MSQNSFLGRFPYGAIGVAALLAACDGEAPTDVAVSRGTAGRVDGPNLAVNAGKPSSSSYEKKSFGFDVASGSSGVMEVYCSAGKRALGGGFQIGGGVLISGPDVAVYESSPRVTDGTDGWRLEAVNRGPDTRRFDVWVVCATI